MGFCVQLGATLWKNALLKYRGFVTTICEIALPLIVICAMIIFRSLITTTNNTQDFHQADYVLWGSANAQCYAVNQIPMMTKSTSDMFNGLRGQLQAANSAQCGCSGGCPRNGVPNSCNVTCLAENVNIANVYKQIFGMHKLAIAGPNPTLVNNVKAAFYQLYPHLEKAEFITTAYSTNGALDSYVQSSDYGSNPSNPYLAAAIVFSSDTTDPTQVAAAAAFNVNYQIRMNASSQNFAQTPDPYQVPYSNDAQWTYSTTYSGEFYQRGYFFLQDFVETYFLQQAAVKNVAGANANTFLNRELTMAPFPTVAYISDNFPTLVGNVIGLLYTLAYLWPVTRLIKGICEEKELRIREGMKMMGLSEGVLFVGWFITYALMFAITAALITLITYPSVFPYSNKGYIFWFFWLFGFDAFAFCWMVSCFFNRAQMGAIAGGVIFLGLYLVNYALSTSATAGTKALACLSAPICFAQTAMHIANQEAAQVGVTASSANHESNDNFTYNLGIGLMIVDFFLYTGIGLYFSRVFRGEYGFSEPWYFCVSPKFWCPQLFHHDRSKSPLLNANGVAANGGEMKEMQKRRSDLNIATEEEKGMVDRERENEAFMEPVSEALKEKVAVRIEKLRREFQVEGHAAQVAVNDISIDLYEGQIFVLLGHNGAGKSTTINMLTGMYPPTSGDAVIYGKSVMEEMELIRKEIGVCPQHNILFPELTVKEHLSLYAKIKGVDASRVQNAITEIVDQVGLMEKLNTYSSALSGGQQRKLSLAIALIGDSKVVFLDEPTSGMDPFSRRFTWDLLKKKKEGRVIILTTHFMDEADQLGDRIAIMHGGEIKCCGSSLFLKSKYGVGYTLTITKGEGHFKESVTRDMILRTVPGSEELTNVAGEISFRLPLGESAHFPDLFDQLDLRKEDLGLESYGISVTTLEEVFLRVGRGDAIKPETRALRREASLRLQRENSVSGHRHRHDIGEDEPKVDVDEKKASEMHSSPTAASEDQARRKSSFSALNRVHVVEFSGSMFLHHVEALFRKRMMAAYRDRKTWCFTVFCPALLILIGLLALTFAQKFTYPNTVLALSNGLNKPMALPIAAQTANASTELFPFVSSFGTFLHPIDKSSIPVIANAPNASMAAFYMANYLIGTWTDPNANLDGNSRYAALVSNLVDNGLSLTDTGVVMYNSTATYSLLIAANLYNSLYMKKITGNSASNIQLSDAPLPITLSLQQLQSTVLSTFIGLAMAFVPLGFVAYVVKEDTSKVKHQQLISGVSNAAYWTANYLWDFVNYLIPAALLLILLAIFNVGEFTGSNSGALILGLILYGLAIIPFSYVFSFLFKNYVVAIICIMMAYIILGAVLYIVATVLDFIGGQTQTIDDQLKYVFRLTPIYCITEICGNMITRSSQALYGTVVGLWDITIVGYPMIYLAWESFFWFAVLLGIEYIRYTPDLVSRLMPSSDLPEEKFEDDEDVIKEKERLLSSHDPTPEKPGDIITIKGMRKVYPSANGQPPKTAVHSLYLGIPEGQCFGYLGINGAGKTTTMKMLTGDVLPSKGLAYLNGMDISKHQMEVRRLIGYCPQFDALIETLTGREHLQLFARIKGVDPKEIPTYVERLIKRLGLQEGIADKPAAGYSGGNKRKLCVGIALIGNPPIVFLDEPSTGMDPGSRRFMWDLIAATMKGRSVILTTHSMDECEALCTRLGIMVGGRLRCLGTLQHLRSRYGNDYQVDVHLKASAEQQAQFHQWMNLTFPGVKLLEAHGETAKVRVPKVLADGTRVSIANMFRIFEKERKRFGITDYSVSETTLEQIFIHFAKQQEMLDEKVYEQVGMQAEQPNTPGVQVVQSSPSPSPDGDGSVYVNLSAQATTPAVEGLPDGDGVGNLVEVRPAGSSAAESTP